MTARIPAAGRKPSSAQTASWLWQLAVKLLQESWAKERRDQLVSPFCVLSFLKTFSRNAPVFQYLSSKGEIKRKSTPKPPPLCTYMQVSHALTCSCASSRNVNILKHIPAVWGHWYECTLAHLHFTSLWPSFPGAGRRSASRLWTSHSRKIDVLWHLGFRLYCLWVSTLETCHLPFLEKHDLLEANML